MLNSCREGVRNDGERYVYDPDAGDPAGGVPPGTPFAELPEDWTCPVCGASKDVFEKA
ncbi:rubredoxin [Desulforudis sp. 1088]|uniref:rubredoxin n=1 Tax=unclassified Candidatus Desulforudis TaxID=2635950 RepID=UPI003CF18BE8